MEDIAATEESVMAPEYSEANWRDGFRFGLGFVIAGCLVWIAFAVILLVLLMALT